MNKLHPNLSQNWLIVVLLYVLACSRSGNYYNPHAENNTAYIGVMLADSIMNAFNERFVPEPTNGSVGSMSATQETSKLINALNAALNANSTLNLEAALKANLAATAQPKQRPESTQAPRPKPHF